VRCRPAHASHDPAACQAELDVLWHDGRPFSLSSPSVARETQRHAFCVCIQGVCGDLARGDHTPSTELSNCRDQTINVKPVRDHIDFARSDAKSISAGKVINSCSDASARLDRPSGYSYESAWAELVTDMRPYNQTVLLGRNPPPAVRADIPTRADFDRAQRFLDSAGGAA
jgi:hypothetical protein